MVEHQLVLLAWLSHQGIRLLSLKHGLTQKKTIDLTAYCGYYSMRTITKSFMRLV